MCPLFSHAAVLEDSEGDAGQLETSSPCCRAVEQSSLCFDLQVRMDSAQLFVFSLLINLCVQRGTKACNCDLEQTAKTAEEIVKAKNSDTFQCQSQSPPSQTTRACFPVIEDKTEVRFFSLPHFFISDFCDSLTDHPSQFLKFQMRMPI